jgi:hypothetical protein
LEKKHILGAVDLHNQLKSWLDLVNNEAHGQIERFAGLEIGDIR